MLNADEPTCGCRDDRLEPGKNVSARSLARTLYNVQLYISDLNKLIYSQWCSQDVEVGEKLGQKPESRARRRQRIEGKARIEGEARDLAGEGSGEAAR